MARFTEPTPEQEALWAQWVSERPQIIQDVASRFEPWSLYLMKETGQRVTLVSFSEDGTLTVCVSGEFNLVMHERNVFGINPDDLEPCELPAKGEALGSVLSSEEVEENLDALRCMVRPDLWRMGDDGIAVKKTTLDDPSFVASSRCGKPWTESSSDEIYADTQAALGEAIGERMEAAIMRAAETVMDEDHEALSQLAKS